MKIGEKAALKVWKPQLHTKFPSEGMRHNRRVQLLVFPMPDP